MSTLEKGVVYSGPDDPELKLSIGKRRSWRNKSRTQQEDWVAEHNRRSTIVAKDRLTGKELVSEEITAHCMNQVPPSIRHMARMINDLNPFDRQALISLFPNSGDFDLGRFVELDPK